MGVRSGSLTSPGFSFAITSVEERRQLRALAPAERAAFERRLAVGVGDRELGEILAVLGCARRRRSAFLPRFFELLRRGGLRHGDQDVRDVVFADCSGAFFCLLQVLVDLARRDGDALDHVALAQQRERELLAHGVAIAGVVDALRGQRLRQLRQRDVVALGDFLERAVQRLVGNLEAGAVRALHLDFLQHQPLEHLLAQHVLRRQLELLLAQALGDHGDLLVELALEHDAVVDHGGDAVEQRRRWW